MMGKRKLWGVLFIITALVIMQLPVSEADAATSASDFKMEGSTLVKYVGTETTVSVPNTVEIIGESAFEENDYVQKVVLPDSVKQIKEYAFWGCDRLSTVTLGKGLTEIGDYSFTNCKGLKEMTIPSNVKSIGIQAFADCVNMTDITIPYQVTQIHDTAFDGCSRLVIHAETGSYADKYALEFADKQEEMPEYEDVPDYPNGDSIVDDSNGEEPQVTEEDGTDIAEQEGNLLGSTQIVGNQAVVFIDNTSATVIGGMQSEEHNDGYHSESNQGDISENISESDKEKDGFPKYTIVDGKIVADQAYYRNSSLTEVNLPAGIEEIGQFSFARSSVSRITIPEGVKTIGYGAFYHCKQLSEIALPSTIETVEPKAFTHSLWMEQFLEGGDEYLISGNVLIAYKGQGSTVLIPEGVTVIAAEAFKGNTQIQEVVFPDSVRIIGEDAFANCSALSELTFGENLQKIKDRAFYGCALEEVVLPDSLQEQGLQVFEDNVTVRYQGDAPQQTHETSAERLSNEGYRNLMPETLEPGVSVDGIQGGYAQLEGALRRYTVNISMENQAENATDVLESYDSESSDKLRKAYQRALGTTLPQNAVCYTMRLTDGSDIPLTKLGKQKLVIRIPVPDGLQTENICVAALDRNGQLEKISAERVLVDGVNYVKFSTNKPSDFVVYGNGTMYDESTVVSEESVTFSSMSANSGYVLETSKTVNRSFLKALKILQWSVSGLLMVLGLGCLIYKKK